MSMQLSGFVEDQDGIAEQEHRLMGISIDHSQSLAVSSHPAIVSNSRSKYNHDSYETPSLDLIMSLVHYVGMLFSGQISKVPLGNAQTFEGLISYVLLTMQRGYELDKRGQDWIF